MPVVSEPVVEDWCEIASFVEAPMKVPLVVQFATQACVLCPDASQRIHRLMETHHFEWHHMDATVSNLAEELEVTKLPAILVFHSHDRYKLYQQLRDDDVNRVIDQECDKRLVLNADF